MLRKNIRKEAPSMLHLPSCLLLYLFECNFNVSLKEVKRKNQVDMELAVVWCVARVFYLHKMVLALCVACWCMYVSLDALSLPPIPPPLCVCARARMRRVSLCARAQ